MNDSSRTVISLDTFIASKTQRERNEDHLRGRLQTDAPVEEDVAAEHKRVSYGVLPRRKQRVLNMLILLMLAPALVFICSMICLVGEEWGFLGVTLGIMSIMAFAIAVIWFLGNQLDSKNESST